MQYFFTVNGLRSIEYLCNMFFFFLIIFLKMCERKILSMVANMLVNSFAESPNDSLNRDSITCLSPQGTYLLSQGTYLLIQGTFLPKGTCFLPQGTYLLLQDTHFFPKCSCILPQDPYLFPIASTFYQRHLL